MEEEAHSTQAGLLEVRYENGHKVLNGAHSNLSFGRLEQVFKSALRYFRFSPRAGDGILILGFGGGSIAKILRNIYDFPQPITAVELDSELLALARKHFSPYFEEVELHQVDANAFLERQTQRYRYIFIDLFIDEKVPYQFTSEDWLRLVHNHLAPGGEVFHNVMLKPFAEENLLKKYQQHFSKVETFRKFETNLVIRARA